MNKALIVFGIFAVLTIVFFVGVEILVTDSHGALSGAGDLESVATMYDAKL